jgi:predicted lipoprotein with Yx(FWY)xxD motif
LAQGLGLANAQPGEQRKYSSVGAGLDRDLPPSQLIPDAQAAPAGAVGGHPAEVTFRDSPMGLIYTALDGRSLYVMKVYRLRYAGAAETYCTGACTLAWKALPAPADAKPVGAWTVVTGPQGPQWAYGKRPVFLFSGDKQSGDLNGHERDDIFLAINYVPPAPTTPAPGGIEPLFVNHREYVFSYQGRPVYGYGPGASCAEGCKGLTPLAAPLGAKNIGDWTIIRHDGGSLWTYAGKRLFVAANDDAAIMDAAAMVRVK